MPFLFPSGHPCLCGNLHSMHGKLDELEDKTALELDEELEETTFELELEETSIPELEELDKDSELEELNGGSEDEELPLDGHANWLSVEQVSDGYPGELIVSNSRHFPQASEQSLTRISNVIIL